MNYVYFDWNVFNLIEKKSVLSEEQQRVFSAIEKLILDGKIVCPYSNAHINDLLRGYFNDSNYISGHLETLSRLTNNLCIVQYWGNQEVVWHYRNTDEFFNSALEETDVTSGGFTKLLSGDTSGRAVELYEMLRKISIPANFKELYKADPIFDLIFPRTKNELNALALCEDIHEFSANAKKDYSLYKALRTFANKSLAKLKTQKDLFAELNKDDVERPNYLNSDEMWERHSGNTKTSDNPVYQRIINAYFKIDFRGIKSDEKFSNLIDDALHVFYGAHCEYFITLDDRCLYKTKKTYDELGIATKAMKPLEFINSFQVNSI